jgi:AraC-like DNA-binding protein
MQETSIFQYFVIAGLINTALFSFLLLTKARNTAASFILILFMLLGSFQAVLNAFDNRAFFMGNPHLSRISWLFPSLFGPLIYLFIKKITTDSRRFMPYDLLHLIPFLFYFAALSGWFFRTAEEKRLLLTNFEELNRLDFGWLNQLSIFVILFYLLLSLRQLQKFRREIENAFSEISSIRLEWLRIFVYSVLIILAVSALGFYGRKWNLPFLSNFYHYNYALVVLLIYWIAYKTITRPELVISKMQPLIGADSTDPVLDLPRVADIDESVEPARKKYSKSGLAGNAATNLYEKLLNHFQAEKPYLESELNIYKLSDQLNTNRHHLSQVINEKSGRSFFDFINWYRVGEVKQKLADPSSKNKNILGIAFDCGFNSKATFNAAFKKHTGTTPSAYLKSLSDASDLVGSVD